MKGKVFLSALLATSVFVLIIAFVVGVFQDLSDEVEISIDDNGNSVHHDAVYYTPEADALLSNEDIIKAKLLTVTSFEQLQNVVGNMSVNIIYIHPEVVNDIDATWLQQIHSEGIIIAALNTPISQLTGKLNIPLLVDDIDLEQAYDRIGVAAVWSTRHQDGWHGNGQLSEFFPNFQIVDEIVRESFLEINPLDVPTITVPENLQYP
jgi:hypothetical protein